MVNYKNILTGVAERLSVLREERPSAGTRYRLMGMVADIMEVAEEPTQQVNDALGGLSDVLTQIGSQLSRRHKDEE